MRTDVFSNIDWYTECPNKFGIRLRKKCILLRKIAFEAFFTWTTKWKWLFQATFLHLLSKLIHNTKCFKKPFFNLQFIKKANKAISWSDIHFFRKLRNFLLQTFLSFKTWYLSYSKLVGTPCRLCAYHMSNISPLLLPIFSLPSPLPTFIWPQFPKVGRKHKFLLLFLDGLWNLSYREPITYPFVDFVQN